MKKLTVILIFQFAFNVFFAQNDKPERESLNIKLYVDSTHFYNQEVNSGTYFIAENVLQVYLSEKVFMEAEVSKFGIRALKTVKENLNPDRTIVIEFYQTAKGNRHLSSNLKISNPFDKNLKYKAKVVPMNSDKMFAKEVKPLPAKANNVEVWPELSVKVILSDWELEL